MTIKQTLILMAVAGLGLASCQTKPAATVAEQPGAGTGMEIDSVTAKRFVNNYGPHAGEIIDSTMNPSTNKFDRSVKPQTRCIWFSEKQLRALLDKIKKEDGDGIRFYLATYDKKLGTAPATGKTEKIFWGYNTLVMVSTKEKVITPDSSQHWDYYKNTTPTAPGSGFIIGAGPENRGEICPPPRDCPKIGATLIQ